jgi:hypothetical protein
VTEKAAYSAPSRLRLMLDLERVLTLLCDHLPGEPPALIAWGPGALAEKVADGLLSLDPPPEYRCDCGQAFPEHLARVAHAATCPAVVCRDIHPLHLDPPPGPPCPPRRCALPSGHEGDHCADRRPERLSVTWANTATPQKPDPSASGATS